MSSGEVVRLVERAKNAGCLEALFTLGEKPEVYPEARKKLGEFGYSNMVSYLKDLCKQTLKLGLLPHTNAGLLSKRELRRLRKYNSSMGLMLECAADLPVHKESPSKNPKLRLKMIEAAGKLRIPFTTGLLIGIGESHEDRIRSLLAIRKLHERYGHIQEVIIQPFVPKPNTSMADHPKPSYVEILTTVATARSLMPGMNIQVPPNLVSGVGDLLRAGANDLGGISPLTPDFINPENPWPTLKEIRSSIVGAGFVPRERLPIYPRYAKDPRFMSSEVEARVSQMIDGDGYRRFTNVRNSLGED